MCVSLSPVTASARQRHDGALLKLLDWRHRVISIACAALEPGDFEYSMRALCICVFHAAQSPNFRLGLAHGGDDALAQRGARNAMENRVGEEKNGGFRLCGEMNLLICFLRQLKTLLKRYYARNRC